MTDENIERGAAEESSPLTPTEVEASRTPPSQGGAESAGQPSEEHDEAESASGTDV